MIPRIRHCVECPKCGTRYLLARTQYANGSYLVVQHLGCSEEYTLYCSCGLPATITRWNWSDLAKYTVSSGAHQRGYGSRDEITFFTSEQNQQAALAEYPMRRRCL